jgi:endonuclease YncB( thermonuclease family)
MQRPFLCIGITLLIVFTWSVPASAWDGRVTKVLDGDSFRVRHGRTITNIRLYGIDTPEYGQTGWQRAKQKTSALVKGARVSIQPMDVDRYGRTVALVSIGGQLLNAELVRGGWAWVYPRYCHAQPLCRQMKILEKDARTYRRGIWQQKHPVPPWVWKHRTH